MLYNDKFKTDSNRLKNWDYSSEAVYFITIVTKNRESIFGNIEEDKMILSENGQIVERELLKSIKIRKNWFFHNWIIMPNHIHLLIEIQNEDISTETNTTSCIVEANSVASTSSISATECNESLSINVAETHCGASLQNQSDEIIDSKLSTTNIVETHCSASTSSISTKKCSESKFSRKSNSISSFVAIFKSITTKQINGTESIWQTNYHDHIVRNYKTFEKIYDYIKHNPISWDTDSLK
ncbi:Transposase IS200 like [Flavobacterium phragmitis]|uniref:Transposase IS200 like n=2 Tax=Flavobacterium phragmitis TaxID=739143 RepID=A0A1I1W6Z3_9FLAO|nr:Transposase IS200 like [Flavobacterium phragmitis]